MGHYAKVINGWVQQVIVAKADFINTLPDKDLWIKTSYNTRDGKHYKPNTVTPELSTDQSKALRGNFAGLGCIYDPVKDWFYDPRDIPDTNTTPSGKPYVWSESSYKFIEVDNVTNLNATGVVYNPLTRLWE